MGEEVFVCRNKAGEVIVMNSSCQKLIVTDESLIAKGDDEIKNFYTKVFNDIKKTANARRG